jgi:hypothetical protein
MILESSSESFLHNNAIGFQNPYAIPLPDAGIKLADDDRQATVAIKPGTPAI